MVEMVERAGVHVCAYCKKPINKGERELLDHELIIHRKRMINLQLYYHLNCGLPLLEDSEFNDN